jgi:hypothetical protein
MADTAYLVMAMEEEGTVKTRIVSSESKARETCERWGRVPTFHSVGYVPSQPIEWDYEKMTFTKKVHQ